MDKYKTKRTINKWFSSIKFEQLSPNAREIIAEFDHYSKKLTFKKVMWLFLYAINDQTKSLRHLRQQLVNPQLKKVIGLDKISYSQLSRALRGIECSVLMEIFNQLLSFIQEKTEIKSKKKLYLIDSSTFSLSKPSYEWAHFRPTKSGIKLHLKICLMEDGWLHPDQFELSHASEHDHEHIESFIKEPLATYVFDRGYLDFERFDEMNEKGFFFVSRIKKNTKVHVQAHIDGPKPKEIVSDQLVLLGSNVYLTGLLRLVTVERKHHSSI